MCTTSSWSNHGDDGDHVGLGFLTPPTYHKVANNKHWQTTINRQTFGFFFFLLSAGCADKCYMFFRSFRIDFWVFDLNFGFLDFSK